MLTYEVFVCQEVFSNNIIQLFMSLESFSNKFFIWCFLAEEKLENSKLENKSLVFLVNLITKFVLNKFRGCRVESGLPEVQKLINLDPILKVSIRIPTPTTRQLPNIPQYGG